jgi:hypothetical protein
MAWFRRRVGSGEDGAGDGEPRVASDLAEFLAQATEGKALTEAIGEAHSVPDKPAVSAPGRDVPPRGAGHER